MPLNYHQRSLALLQREAINSPRHVQVLDALEDHHQIKLPASVREWYTLEFATEVLRSDDFPIPIDQLGETSEWLEFCRETIVHGVLLVMRENQDVVHWCVQLDGSDDPPVVTREPDAIATEPWKIASSSFSDFIYARLWDRQTERGHHLSTSTFRPKTIALSDETRDLLAQTFTPVATKLDSYLGLTYRFERNNQRLLIYSNPQHSYSVWVAQADTLDALYDLLKTIWHWDSIGREFWAMYRQSPEAELLKRLQDEMKAKPT